MPRSIRPASALPAALAALVLGLAPFALACRRPTPLGSPPDFGGSVYDPPAASGSLTLSGGTQSGAMGNITDFSGTVTRYTGDYYGSVSSVRLDSEGSDWWVMSALQINGDLAGDDFVPGTHRVYTSGVSSDPGSTTRVDVTGCSGPSYGNYTFDTHASEVEVSVNAVSADVRHLDFVATFGAQVTRGGFDYRLPAATGATDPRGI